MDIQVDLSNTVLETDRMILRPWKDSDISDFYEYASVPGVGEMAGWKHHKSQEDTKKILDMFIKEKNVFAVVFKENGKVIGSLGLHNSWANYDDTYKLLKVKEIGYVLSKDYWGFELMPEAVKRLIMFCFNNLNLQAVTIGHFKDNNQSKRVIEKCGLKYFRTYQYYAKELDETFEYYEYILLSQENNGRQL